MPCFSPLRAWKSRLVNESGKRSLVFKSQHSDQPDDPLDIPCGQCIGCRLERSRQWAIRCVHEASLYENNCFLTLTYNDENLPDDGSLHKEHFQKFMKRLRKKFPRSKEDNIRYFHCGEYGEQNYRPHYHACIFNFDFDDKILWSTKNGFRLYTSDTLQKLWPFGYCIIGDVTFESAAYVARYIMKKVTGKKADEHYQGLEPEYTTMSRRPGIGKGWLDSYLDDVYPSNFIVMNGKKMNPPKYYDKELEKLDDCLHSEMKSMRQAAASKHSDNNTLRRLTTRETVKLSQIKRLERPIEME